MTWKDFKEKVESKGVSDDTKIHRIEIGGIGDVNLHKEEGRYGKEVNIY